MAERAAVLAPAKVNLRLKVLAREEGGYHALESIFQAVSLADEVAVRRAGEGIRLVQRGGVDTGPPERNLAVRAAEGFYRALAMKPGIEIHLTKNIPAAAGLGGGSSDAAAVLRALNALEGEPLPLAALRGIAIRLGADVPFFLCGSPLALGWGRGERLMPLVPLPPRPIVIVHPGAAMPTADAFRALAASRATTYAPEPAQIDPAALRDWDRVTELAENDFDEVVARQLPQVGAILSMARTTGARIALVAGSGASVFAIFGDADVAEAGRAAIGGRMRSWLATTLTEMPPIALE